MRQLLRTLTTRGIDAIADRIAARLASHTPLADNIAHRVALEALFNDRRREEVPIHLLSGISDDFWLWMCTDGYRHSARLRDLLPGVPDESVQLTFTGHKGDSVLREGFAAYQLFKEHYTRHAGPVGNGTDVLDFGCGWGRIIRFFIKDVEPARLWGCDPVEAMIDLCRDQNRWCQFRTIDRRPPSPFQDDSFDLIYSFSVFSHLSEEMSTIWLEELTRILRPGGLLMVTTRSRDFIEECAEMRTRPDLESVPDGPRSSASAFPHPQEALARYDEGQYCFSQLVHEGEWSYWGETAIPKDYVERCWTRDLTLVDYVCDPKRLAQNVVVLRKPAT